MTTAPKSIGLTPQLAGIIEFEQRAMARARHEVAEAQKRLLEASENEEAWLAAIELPPCCRLRRSVRRRSGDSGPDLLVYPSEVHEGTPLVIIKLRHHTPPQGGMASWIVRTGKAHQRRWPRLLEMWSYRERSLSVLQGRVLLKLVELGIISWVTGGAEGSAND